MGGAPKATTKPYLTKWGRIHKSDGGIIHCQKEDINKINFTFYGAYTSDNQPDFPINEAVTLDSL